MNNKMDLSKVFNDPIHSSIQVPSYCQMIIDTPEFQRLRFIKQLGCTHYVFPSAVHTRFEHSIGVSHLAGKLATILQQNDRNSSTPVQDHEVACVEIAGLCHDLGHGPFSHVFEDIVPPLEDGKKWKHEKQSVILFKYLIEENNLKKKLEEHNIYQPEIEFICELILGGEKEESLNLLRENKFYLHQIVNNSSNGVDVDKWDYFARDTYYLGMKSSFDFNRIMPFVKVFEVKRGSKTRRELCFRDKVAKDLNQMFITRLRLHEASYQHRVTKVIGIMLKDASLAAAEHLIFLGQDGNAYNLLESVQDPKAFCQVNDTIVNEIMRSQSQEPGMKKAQEIIERIHNRQLYQCIGECKPTSEKIQNVDPAKVRKMILNDEELLSLGRSPFWREIWQADNIEVEVSHFDYGSGHENPLLEIPFYEKTGDGKFHAKLLREESEDKLPADLPQRMKYVIIRIYTKVYVAEPDPKTKKILEQARSWCNDKLKEIVRIEEELATPIKMKPIGGYGTMASSPPSGSHDSPMTGGEDDLDDAGTLSVPGELRSSEQVADQDYARRQLFGQE